jgi:alanine racemase
MSWTGPGGPPRAGKSADGPLAAAFGADRSGGARTDIAVPSRPTLTVHCEAIAANTRTLAATAAPSRLMAVVKADAYGHEDQIDTMLGNGATWLGVTSIEEAVALRERGVRAPVLSWLNPVDADFATAIRAGIDVAAPSVAHLTRIEEVASRLRRQARVHLHVDVGMARDGVPYEEWSSFCARALAAQSGRVRVIGLMGHLSSAHDPTGEAQTAEVRRFRSAVRVARAEGLRPTAVHLAATAAVLHDRSTHFDMVRVGAGLYGIDPSRHDGRSGVLRGALTFTAPVVGIRDVPAGTGVGYGHTHVTSAATRLALIAVGYADGVPRAASGAAMVQVHGRRRPLVGTVSMDQAVIDVGTMDVKLGDVVTVFGPGDDGEPTVGEWATWAGTIPQEIVTGIGRRVVRRIGPAGPPKEEAA